MSEFVREHRCRLAAFAWLARYCGADARELPRALLEGGFDFEGERIRLVGPQGIFKPRSFQLPLSITTSPESPYSDRLGDDGLVYYRYRGDDPSHRDNVGLRQALERRVPLVYFHGIVPGLYLAAFPVLVVHDDPRALTFTVQVEELALAAAGAPQEWERWVAADAGAEARRAYITRAVCQRLHQRSFRVRVLRAYREHCALCRLRHGELLDAAHIIPDGEPDGEPLVTNGVALCKLHHAAFDHHLIGIRPDYVVQVRGDILEEKDGPMLIHGLQSAHGQRILLPSSAALRPDRDLLARRFERFRAAG